MKGSGNNFSTLFKKLWFFCLPTSGMRSRYLKRNSKMFRAFGEKVFYQPRTLPSDPEYISIGSNVKIASGIVFINHDVIHYMFNDAHYSDSIFLPKVGCIMIGNNVMIGAKVLIMPNVKIGNNVIIAAGSIVTKDIPSNTIWGGVPARFIGRIEELIEKRKYVSAVGNEEVWEDFKKQRSNDSFSK